MLTVAAAPPVRAHQRRAVRACPTPPRAGRLGLGPAGQLGDGVGAAVLNAMGDLGAGRGGEMRPRTALAAGRRHSVGRRCDGRVVAVGGGAAGELEVGRWEHVVAVAAGNVHAAANTGRSHTVGLRGDGTVVATGWNGDGQCDLGSWRGVVAVAAGGGEPWGCTVTAPSLLLVAPPRVRAMWTPGVRSWPSPVVTGIRSGSVPTGPRWPRVSTVGGSAMSTPGGADRYRGGVPAHGRGARRRPSRRDR